MSRTWRISTAEFLLSPFVFSGFMLTCHKLFSKYVFHSVIGAGRRPIPSELITIAGRVFRISAPFVGFKSICQISPRLGFKGLVVSDVPSLQLAPLVRSSRSERRSFPPVRPKFVFVRRLTVSSRLVIPATSKEPPTPFLRLSCFSPPRKLLVLRPRLAKRPVEAT